MTDRGCFTLIFSFVCSSQTHSRLSILHQNIKQTTWINISASCQLFTWTSRCVGTHNSKNCAVDKFGTKWMLALSVRSSIMRRSDGNWKDSVILSAEVWHHRLHPCRPLHKHSRSWKNSNLHSGFNVTQNCLCCFVWLWTKTSLMSVINIRFRCVKSTFVSDSGDFYWVPLLHLLVKPSLWISSSSGFSFFPFVFEKMHLLLLTGGHAGICCLQWSNVLSTT